MPPTTLPSFTEGLAASVPIVLGYFPIAFAFGVAATGQGLSAIDATLLSVIIFAGASQFLAISLLTGGAPFLVAAFTLIAMNLRHVIYGPALMNAAKDGQRKRAWLWAFALTDEVFGAALGHLARGRAFSESFMTGLGLGAYASWVSGTALGAFAGGGALKSYPAVEAGLGFMLPALFLALLLSILNRSALPVIATSIGVFGLVSTFASTTTGILTAMFAGAICGALIGGKNDA